MPLMPSPLNVTEILTSLVNSTSDSLHERTRASNAFSDPFTSGIQIVQTVALGILLVLVSIILFYCNEKAKTNPDERGHSGDAKLADLSEKLIGLNGRLCESGDAVGRVEQAQQSLVQASLRKEIHAILLESMRPKDRDDRVDCEKDLEEGVSWWEGNVLRKLN